MEKYIEERIHIEPLRDRVVTADLAASWIKDGMTLGLSGFTRAGDVKAVPFALIRRADKEEFKVNVFTGASLGSDIDKLFAEKGILNKRLPFQADPVMRRKINEGEFYFVDQHLSHTAELVRSNVMETIDFAIVEAISITEDGLIIPTTSVGNSALFAQHAENIIVDINLAQTKELEGVHDMIDPGSQGKRDPIQMTKPQDRIGTKGIKVDIERIKGIVFTEQKDSASTIVDPDEETQMIANHLIDFLKKEVEVGRLTKSLAPLQSDR